MNTFRTPAHASDLTFKELVAVERATQEVDSNIVDLYHNLHLAQGMNNSIDLSERVHTIPAQATSDVNALLANYIVGTVIPTVFKNVGVNVSELTCTNKEYRHEVATAIKEAFNTLWWNALKEDRAAFSALEKIDNKIVLTLKDAPSVEKAQESIDEATRKDNQKDLARAERRMERALAIVAEVEKLTADKEPLWVIARAKREVTNSLVRMEHMSRGLDSIFNPKFSEEDLFAKRVGYLRFAVMFFPELFTPTVNWVDSLK